MIWATGRKSLQFCIRNTRSQTAVFSSAVPVTLISQLRKDTGASILKCKEALEKSGNDVNVAISLLRKRGESINATSFGKLDSTTASRIAASLSHDSRTCIICKTATQTDFASESELFVKFTEALTTNAPSTVSDAEDLKNVNLKAPFSNQIHSVKIGDIISELSGILTEPIAIQSVEQVAGDLVSVYLHNKSQYSDKVASRASVVAFALDGVPDFQREKIATMGDLLAKQILATTPKFVSESDIPSSVIEKEKEVLGARVADQTKIEKAFAGHMKRFVSENCLLSMDWIIPFPGIETGGKSVGQVIEVFCESLSLPSTAVSVNRFVLVK
jgi:elongation factor Ts